MADKKHTRRWFAVLPNGRMSICSGYSRRDARNRLPHWLELGATIEPFDLVPVKPKRKAKP